MVNEDWKGRVLSASKLVNRDAAARASAVFGLLAALANAAGALWGAPAVRGGDRVVLLVLAGALLFAAVVFVAVLVGAWWLRRRGDAS